MIMNYDPNMTNNGRMARQTVRLTFGIWKYRKTTYVNVGGNCAGLDVIETAVDNAYERLPSDDDGVYIELVSESGDEVLHCGDDEDGCEAWLRDMLIGAEIVAVETSDASTRG